MNTIIHATAYFPPIDYIRSVLNVDEISIETCENYQKRSYRNRTLIQTANGPLSLSIPVNKTLGAHTPIKKIEIDYTSNWQHDHWQAIQSAYNKSPYFEYYSYLFEPFFQKKWNMLFDYNMAILNEIFKILSIQVPILYTKEFIANPFGANDYRNLFQTHKSGTLLYTTPPYTQVFGHKFPFEGKISILDTIFNLGPETTSYLHKMK